MQTSRSVIFQFFFYFITMLNILCFFPAASPHDAVTFVICKCNLLFITFLIYDIQVLYQTVSLIDCFGGQTFHWNQEPPLSRSWYISSTRPRYVFSSLKKIIDFWIFFTLPRMIFFCDSAMSTDMLHYSNLKVIVE